MFSTLISVVGADNESTGAALMKKVMEDLDEREILLSFSAQWDQTDRNSFPGN